MIRERILGPSTSNTLKGLVLCADYYVRDLQAYQRAVDLLKYGISLSDDLFIAVPLICEAFWQLYDKNADSVRFSDVSDVLGTIVAAINGRAWTSSAEHCLNDEWFRDLVCLLFVHLVDLLCQVTSTEDEVSSVRQIVDSLVRTRCRTGDGRTLLHLAVHPECWIKHDDHCDHPWLRTLLPSSVVVGHLLDAGATADATDVGKNTPLHTVVFNEPETSPARNEIVDLLLQHGAHVDAANADGRTASNCLSPSLVFNHVSLKCLAARAVLSYKLPYRGTVPTTLANFVV